MKYFVNGYDFGPVTVPSTAQKMKFSMKDFFSKCDQIRSFLQLWSHLLKKPLIENFVFCAVHCNSMTFTVASKQEIT